MSKANKQQVPKVRFTGFSDTWKSKKISDLSETTIGGGTPSTSVGKYWEGEIPWIQSSDIILDDVLNITPTKFITREALQNSAARMVPENSLAIVTRVGVGKLCVLPYQYATSQDFLSLVNLNIDKFYITYNLYRFLQEEKHKVQGTAIKGITKSDLLNKKVLITESLKEQTQIGNFFQQLDKLIELQTRAVESAETYKKAMLQKMFPQKGEKVPRVRFEGFSGDWKLSVLNKLAARFDNLRIPVTASDRIEGETPYYGANGIQGYVEGFTHEGEFVLLAEDGANDLTNYPVQHVFGKIWVNNHAHVLGAKKNIMSNSYLANVLKTINMIPYLVGSGRAKLNSSAMMEIKIKYPILEEQTLIGNLFQKLDQNIKFEKKKLEQYQTMKRALLQRMFV